MQLGGLFVFIHMGPYRSSHRAPTTVSGRLSYTAVGLQSSRIFFSFFISYYSFLNVSKAAEYESALNVSLCC